MITPVQALDIIHAGGEVILERPDWNDDNVRQWEEEVGNQYKITRLDNPDDNDERLALVGEYWWPLRFLTPAPFFKVGDPVIPNDFSQDEKTDIFWTFGKLAFVGKAGVVEQISRNGKGAKVHNKWWPMTALSPADQPEPAAIELTKEALYARWQYFEKRCELAEKFIKETPCDPDITVSQMTAFQEWNRCKDLGHFTPSVALADFLTLYKGAMSVMDSWNERMGGEVEQLKQYDNLPAYYSPAASMVASTNIAELRAALESIKHLIGDEPQNQH